MDLSSFIIVPIGTLFAFLVANRLDPRDRRYALASFGLHVLGSILQWVLSTFYWAGGGGDVMGYQEWGSALARLIDADAGHFLPEVCKLALHLDANLPFEVTGAGSSTGTMSALAGLWIALAGSSLLTMHLAVTCFTWFGQVLAYRTVREELGERDRFQALIGFLLVPSVIFWCSGYDKEAFVIAFLGILMHCSRRLFRELYLPALIGIGVSLTAIAMIKPYTLFAGVVAFAAFLYAERSWRTNGVLRIRPVYLALAAAIALGGIVALGSLFPQFGAEKITDSVAQSQKTWQAMRDNGDSGGSGIDVGGGEQRGAAQQLAFVPLALINSFFRPFLFESKNAPMLGAALENTVLTFCVLGLLGRASRKVALDVIARTPLVVFSLTFCAVFGVAVGLATANLGTLSRYRLPMMPFYVTTVLILRQRGQQAARNGLVATRRSRTGAAARRAAET